MKKAQSVVEYIVAIILFVIIVVYMLNIYFDRLPEEISKIEEQELCSEAESMAYSFLDTSGDPSNWGTPTRLGFSRVDDSSIDYNKWVTAVDRGYYNITEAINLNYTFHLSYFIYAFNYTYDDAPQAANQGSPIAFITRSSDNNINVSAGSAGTVAYFNLTLFFPGASSVTVGNCPAGANLEAGETPGGNARDGGVEVIINWTVSGDEDCATLLPAPVPKLIFITRAILENQSIGKSYPIYIGNHTKLKDEFGSTEYLVVDKSYCEISRKRSIYNHSEFFPARFSLRIW